MWLLPSLNRPERLAAALAAIRLTGTTTPGLVLVGPDDPLPDGLPQHWTAVRRPAEASGLTAGLNHGFKLYPDEPWYGCLGDDNLPRTLGWDRSLVAEAMRSGIASCNDGWMAPHRMTGAPVFRGDLVRALGWLMPPFLEHYYTDDVWEDIGRFFDIWRVRMDVLVEHAHVLRGKTASDATHDATEQHMLNDALAWEQWRASPDHEACFVRVAAALAGEPPSQSPPKTGKPFMPAPSVSKAQGGARRRVLIGTPAHDGRVEVRYVDSLIATLDLLRSRGYEPHPLWMPGDSLVQRARNNLVLWALTRGYDDLLMIDEDQVWRPQDALALLEYPVDVVGAPIRKKDDAREKYNVHAMSPHIPVDPNTGLMIPDGLGTGFIRLSRRALQALWDASEPYRGDFGPTRMVFDLQIINGELVGEDIAMCAKLRRAGIPVHLDPSLAVGHIGPKTYAGDFTAWLRVKQAEAEERQQAA